MQACSKIQRNSGTRGVVPVHAATAGSSSGHSPVHVHVNPGATQPVAQQPDGSVPNFVQAVPILPDSDNEQVLFENDFVQIAVKHRLGRVVVNDFLSLFRRHNIGDFPHDFRSAVRTPRHVEIIRICQGEYHHFGVVRSLCRALKSFSIQTNDCIKLQLNFDGLPLYKSSQVGFWPILCRATVRTFSSKVFLIGLFLGTGKPENVKLFLQKFVDEFLSLDGSIEIQGRDCSLKIDSIVCDAPARAYVKGIKYPGGHYACERCSIKGDHNRKQFGGTRYFEMNCSKRSNDSFRAKSDRNHHRENCPLDVLEIDLVSSFPLDYMHLVLLGVVRRVVKMWFPDARQKKHPYFNVHALRSGGVQTATNRMETCGRCSVFEFQRRPRKFTDLNFFKATEFRHIVMYLFPFVFFKLFQNINVYNHFCLLVVGMRILCCQGRHRSSVEFARECLRTFVEESKDIYGHSFYVYNVHCLIHLADDYEKFGNLDSVSCFPFESFMQKIKRYIKRPGGELAQVAKRVAEEELWTDDSQDQSEFVKLKDERFAGPVAGFQGQNLRHYRKCSVFGKTIQVDSNDDAVCTSEGYGLVRNIFRCDDHVYLVVNFFSYTSNVFSYPCKSSDIGIVFARDLSCDSQVLHIREAVKCFKVPLEADNVTYLVNMLHENV